MCISIPCNFIFERLFASLKISMANVSSMPNLFSAKPVEIYGCVSGSTFGFTLIAKGAVLFKLFAISFILNISCIDSALISNISFSNASIISSSVFPTPDIIIFFAETPAAEAL